MTSQHFIGKREILRTLAESQIETLALTVQGISMVPTLRPNDRVHLKRGLYLPGDIILFVSDDVLVIHRMVGWWRLHGSWYMVTKGDNLPKIDVLVPQGSIIGKVTCWERKGKVYTESHQKRIIKWLLSVGGYIVHRVTRFRLKAY